MKRWYITQVRTRKADGDEREEMGLPRYSSKRSPEVFIEWTEYMNVLSHLWHLEHLFATAFRSKKDALRGLDRVRNVIENECVTLTLMGKSDEAYRVKLVPEDATPMRVPKDWPKNRRKIPERRFFKPNRWPYSKDKAKGRREAVDAE